MSPGFISTRTQSEEGTNRVIDQVRGFTGTTCGYQEKNNIVVNEEEEDIGEQSSSFSNSVINRDKKNAKVKS